MTGTAPAAGGTGVLDLTECACAASPTRAAAALPADEPLVTERAPVAARNAARAAWLAARREDARWAREYLAPWINRRPHGTSSGDGRSAKRPALEPVTPPVT